ncbi:MAG: hypothetical protein Q7T97_03280 [Burkholderiaceae bacterium]|nr:hypothetical protein [Burkholderiaceae bacterium]
MDTTTASNLADDARERLASHLHDLVRESEHLMKAVQRSGNQQVDAVRDRFEATLKGARDELETLQDNALRKARRAARTADNAVHDHPYASMGVAAAVGALIGMLISRR